MTNLILFIFTLFLSAKLFLKKKKKTWDSLNARLNSHYKAWSYIQEKEAQKDLSIQEISLERTYS